MMNNGIETMIGQRVYIPTVETMMMFEGPYLHEIMRFKTFCGKESIMKSYCTQNNGDCLTCSLTKYGRDCKNILLGVDDRQAERTVKRDAALNAADFDTEQAAIKEAAVVDIRPTIPATAADLYHQWDERQEPDTTKDYIAVCKQIGAGFDRGARRYVVHRKDAIKAKDALHAAGFLVCIHPSLMLQEGGDA
jgi:hypothetical protein